MRYDYETDTFVEVACEKCRENPAEETSTWCAPCNEAVRGMCLYCSAQAGEGHYICEMCDRRVREDTRRRNGYPPFTDVEYRMLREKHRRARGTLVVDGSRL